jgi:ParB family transcriptional regulator, chromosome partitioning protein
MATRQNSLKNFVFGEEADSPKSLPSSFLPLSAITIRETQPRRYFDPEKLEELTQSVRQYGILEPLLIRPMEEDSPKYELVAGERRYRAAQKAGLQEVPVSIRQLSDTEAVTISLIENLQREDLNPVEETEGILQLLSFRLEQTIPDVIALLYRMRNEASGAVSQNVLTNPTGQTIQSVFESIGQISWESFITSRLPLLKLPEDVLEVLRQGKIAYTKAKAIASLKDEEFRSCLLDQAISQNLSLSQIKEQIQSKQSLNRHKDLNSPQKTIAHTYRRLRESKLWQNPQKWKKAQNLLQKLEALLEEDSDLEERS